MAESGRYVAVDSEGTLGVFVRTGSVSGPWTVAEGRVARANTYFDEEDLPDDFNYEEFEEQYPDLEEKVVVEEEEVPHHLQQKKKKKPVWKPEPEFNPDTASYLNPRFGETRGRGPISAREYLPKRAEAASKKAKADDEKAAIQKAAIQQAGEADWWNP
jgi:hypothetical protein